jgi:[ribosomal protein S5]-alanine N-acetyltransferase
VATDPQVRIEPASSETLRAALDDKAALAEMIHSAVPDDWPEKVAMFRYAIDRLAQHPDENGWLVYFFYNDAGNLIGSGGYHGPPTDGSVEIGYEIAPVFRERGLGASAAAALIDRAFEDAAVDLVIAKTKPERSASVTILKNLHFTNTGPIYDSDYGDIQWRWVLPRDQRRG